MDRLKRRLKKLAGIPSYKRSYAQCGEDIIVDYLLRQLGIHKPSYLDLGANHPVHLSNTYLFYLRGGKGVCVEPDPILHEGFRKQRMRDTCINAGVGITKAQYADFYIMSSSTLNTFSKEDATRFQGYGSHHIEQIIQVPLIPINDILAEHFPSSLDFVSLDIEGMDLEVLKDFDFTTYRPKVFCVETLSYAEDKTEEKLTTTIEYLLNQNYSVYADTYINTIFVDGGSWKQR